MSDHKTPISRAPQILKLRRTIRIAFGTMGLTVGLLTLYLLTSVFQGSAGDLGRLRIDDDDWSLHITDPEQMAANRVVRSLADEVLVNPAWATTLGLAGGSGTGIENIDQLLRDWPLEEALLSVRWNHAEGTAAGVAAPRPFESFTLVLRPGSRSTMAALRALFLPGLGPLLRASLFPPATGTEVVNGIINVAAPSGLDSSLAGTRGLSFCPVRDLLVLSTSFDDVQRLRTVLRDLDTSSDFERAPGFAHLTLNRPALERLDSTLPDLFGKSAQDVVRGLSTDKPLASLRMSLIDAGGLIVRSSWLGTAWPEAPLRPLAADQTGLALSLKPQAGVERLHQWLDNHDDRETLCTSIQQVLDEQGKPRPPRADWLTEEREAALKSALSDSGLGGLRLFWGATPSDEAPIGTHFTWRARLKNVDAGKALIPALGLPLDDAASWIPLVDEPSGMIQPQVRIGPRFLYLANSETVAEVDRPDTSDMEPITALWQLRTTGEELARGLRMLDAGRSQALTRPTVARRKEIWRALKRPLPAPKVFDQVTASYFEQNERRLRETLQTRSSAFAGLFQRLGTIEASATGTERTQLEITIKPRD